MTVESEEDLIGLRRVGAVVAETIRVVTDAVRAGMTTRDLDAIGRDVLEVCGARSAPKVVYGFPGYLCLSVNDEAVHGIPGLRPLLPGDLLKVDVTAELDGYVADAAVTIALPGAAAVRRRLRDCASDALSAALEVARAGAGTRQVGRAVESVVRRSGFAVLREVGGHGVGRTIHEPPHVPNWNDPLARDRLHEGLVIAVEPIIAAGSGRLVADEDGWTLRTADGSPAAHAEHTIVVTKDSPLVLTAA